MLRKNTPNEFFISTSDGTIHVFDFLKDSLKFKISGDFFANSYYRDKENNFWICTSGKGLMQYGYPGFKTLRPFTGSSIKNTFRSLFIDNSGVLYGGNDHGDVVEFSGSQKPVFKSIVENGDITKVLGVLVSQGKTFVISNWGCIVDYKRFVSLPENEPLTSLKRAIILNDSIIIAAGVSVKGGLYKINTITEKAVRLKIPIIRITSFTTKNGIIYIGTTEGMFQYDYNKGTLSPFGKNNQLSKTGVLSAVQTADGLNWISTVTEGIFVFRGDTLLQHLKDESLLNFPAMKVFHNGAPGRLWLVCRKGLMLINYQSEGQKIKYTIQNANQSPLFANTMVNDVVSTRDSIFLATENGIEVIPAAFNRKALNIKTFLTDIRVNQKSIQLDTSYQLESNQGAVTLTFSGVNLSGLTNGFVYWLDDDKEQNEIVGNTLNLQLEPGMHKLRVRALDVNNQLSTDELILYFNRATPFYNTWWFLFLAATLFSGLVLFVVSKVRTAKRERIQKQQQRIDLERNRITEDLHDDIGSTLSSLKIYSDVAGKMIDKDVPKTKYLLEQISDNSSKILEDIGDIIWSLNPDKQAQLSIDGRIKNYISEVLGNAGIDYKIDIDPQINDVVENISARKNTVLIIKESINNIVKYSQATVANVSVSINDAYLAIMVTDNGMGISPRLPRNGNGLRNMKKRAEELGGTFEMTTEMDAGTQINVKIPVTKIRDKGV